MTTSREYRQFARQCTEWAAETDTSEARNAFHDLASDWTLAALCVDRATKKEASPTVNHLSWRPTTCGQLAAQSASRRFGPAPLRGPFSWRLFARANESATKTIFPRAPLCAG